MVPYFRGCDRAQLQVIIPFELGTVGVAGEGAARGHYPVSKILFIIKSPLISRNNILKRIIFYYYYYYYYYDYYYSLANEAAADPVRIARQLCPVPLPVPNGSGERAAKSGRGSWNSQWVRELGKIRTDSVGWSEFGQ